jgi:hypothetical protein
MPFDTGNLILCFPIAFILHDFEELLLFEPWLKKNAAGIMSRIEKKVPPFLERQLKLILGKSTTQFAFPIFLIFLLTCIASFLAVGFKSYPFFLVASSLFSLHGFMHIGQAIILRKYVPALITSVLVAIPYGGILFPRLIAAGIVDIPGLCLYFVVSIVSAIPFILGMHIAGEFVYKRYLLFLYRK